MKLFHRLKTLLTTEMKERLIWTFLAYLSGVSFYFCFPIDWLLIVPFLIIFGFMSYLWRQHLFMGGISLMCFFFILGLTVPSLKSKLVEHSVLDKVLYQEVLTGTVQKSTFLPDKQIMVLKNIHWSFPKISLPDKVRLTYLHGDPIIETGDRIEVVATIFPPKGQQAPFSIGNASSLWFDGLGGIGYIQTIRQQEKAYSSGSFFEKGRKAIQQHLFNLLPTAQAQVAATLITGEQRLINPDIYQVYRRSGIAHVLSVSGFHMVLLASFLFFVVRGLFALCPKLALYYNSKKIAALLAWAGTFFYLSLSGFQIPALRAFGMISLVFLGILVNRSVFSVRSLILVCFALLLFSPEFILSASFQLSFIAVAVLVALCNWIYQKQWGRVKTTITLFFTLNLGITLALTPFILYHFNQFMSYGIVGNILFSFMFSFLIMPLLFIGTLLMPLSMDFPFFKLAGFLLDKTYKGAAFLADLPYSEIAVPGFNQEYLFLIAMGIALLCFMKTVLKNIGILFIAIGILGGFLTPKPDILISGKVLAFQNQGKLYSSQNGDAWLLKMWQQKLGIKGVVDFRENRIWLKGQKIALHPSQCLGAKLAILNTPAPNECKCETLIPKDDFYYEIYLYRNTSKIKFIKEN